MSDETAMKPAEPTGSRGGHTWSKVAPVKPPKRSATERIADFLEVYGAYDEQTAREQAARCVQCAEPQCVASCPLGNRIPEWLLLTAEGQFLEAAQLCGSTSNFPDVCARVCPQDRLCEGACVLDGKAEPVAIGAIERFLYERAFAGGMSDPPRVARNGLKVAVLGSGPGGLACAEELAKLGYAVTVFDSLPIPGGLLVHGIPAFKLEKSVVARHVARLEGRGVEFRLGVTIGRDVHLSELQSSFDAIFLSFGAQQARRLDVPGADLRGVYSALPFIIQWNTPIRLDLPEIDVAGKRVVVLGGGDTAMDCLRTAIRCRAASATCLYRRDLGSMPGSRREYENSVEEGACFRFLTTPLEVLGDAQGRVVGVRCLRTELGAPDWAGRRRPYPVAGSEFDEPAEVVLVAYGFDPVPFAPGSELGQLATNEWGGLAVDAHHMTNLPGVFAGGDVVRGPSLVVHAVRDARQAAREIHRYLAPRRIEELSLDHTDHVSP